MPQALLLLFLATAVGDAKQETWRTKNNSIIPIIPSYRRFQILQLK
jgi:hypothetical protein